MINSVMVKQSWTTAGTGLGTDDFSGTGVADGGQVVAGRFPGDLHSPISAFGQHVRRLATREARPSTEKPVGLLLTGV